MSITAASPGSSAEEEPWKLCSNLQCKGAFFKPLGGGSNSPITCSWSTASVSAQDMCSEQWESSGDFSAAKKQASIKSPTAAPAPSGRSSCTSPACSHPRCHQGDRSSSPAQGEGQLKHAEVTRRGLCSKTGLWCFFPVKAELHVRMVLPGSC